jgi:hypothetical protein
MADSKTFVFGHRTGLLLLALSGGLWVSSTPAQSDSATATDSSRVVEQKTTVETRRIVETRSVETKAALNRKTAIFVENRAGPQLNDKVLFFEDQVASRAGGKDFSIISREDVLKAVKIYRGADAGVSSRSTEVKGSGTLSGEANLKTTDDRQGTVVGSAAAFPEHAVAGGRADAQVKSERTLDSSGKLSGGLDTSSSRTDVRSEAMSDAERNTLGTKLDQSLSDSSSALRMAQNIGADFILFVTIGSYAKET